MVKPNVWKILDFFLMTFTPFWFWPGPWLETCLWPNLLQDNYKIIGPLITFEKNYPLRCPRDGVKEDRGIPESGPSQF